MSGDRLLVKPFWLTFLIFCFIFVYLKNYFYVFVSINVFIIFPLTAISVSNNLNITITIPPCKSSATQRILYNGFYKIPTHACHFSPLSHPSQHYNHHWLTPYILTWLPTFLSPLRLTSNLLINVNYFQVAYILIYMIVFTCLASQSFQTSYLSSMSNCFEPLWKKTQLSTKVVYKNTIFFHSYKNTTLHFLNNNFNLWFINMIS